MQVWSPNIANEQRVPAQELWRCLRPHLTHQQADAIKVVAGGMDDQEPCWSNSNLSAVRKVAMRLGHSCVAVNKNGRSRASGKASGT